MTAETFSSGRAFLTPAFRIELDGRDTGREVISDVLEIAFTDDLNAVDSFEFLLHDWDPVALRSRYSSPWDGDGRPHTLYQGGPQIPNFEPGARVSLYLGYLEDGDLPLIMEGEVISLAPSFPASGSPTCRVRALDGFLRGLQKVRVKGNRDGTAKEVIETLCAENDVEVRFASIEDEGEAEENVEVMGTLYDEIEKRAKEYGLSLTTLPGSSSDPVLFLTKPVKGDSDPVAEFVWGRTLISFTPVVSAAGQISAVIVRGGNPDAPPDEQPIEVRRTWSDIGLSPSALGPAGAADLETAVRDIEDEINPKGVATVEDAERAADEHLTRLAESLITGSGSAIGLPTLRTGATVVMGGLGARFDGVYRLTQTTHALAGAGYTTTFQVRKEVLDG